MENAWTVKWIRLYGKIYAEIHDDLFKGRDDLDVVSRVLYEHAGSQAALEFGIGTGRVALPLANHGVRVFGIDNSEAMLSKLHAKAGANQIVTKTGSFVTERMEGDFSLVFCVFSTLYLVSNQNDQVQTFANAARHLKPGGIFVVEGFVHDRRRFQFDQEAVTTHVAPDVVELRASKLNAANQTIEMNRVLLTQDGVKFYPNTLRFIYPSEMDLMARLNGFALHARWGGWDRAPFNANSQNQVVVYEKVAA